MIFNRSFNKRAKQKYRQQINKQKGVEKAKLAVKKKTTQAGSWFTNRTKGTNTKCAPLLRE
jgi:hypothetical protein